MSALIDTGFLLAVASFNDSHHAACNAVIAQEHDALIPSIVLPELAYMVIRDIGRPAWVILLRKLLAHDNIINATHADLARAADIMQQYADAKLDFVDCTIMAIAERLDITRILTVDRRDFSLFRPKHTAFFTILP